MNAKSRTVTTGLAVGLAVAAFTVAGPARAARHGESSQGQSNGRSSYSRSSERSSGRSESSRGSARSYERSERQRQQAPAPAAAPSPRYDRGSSSRPVDVGRPAPRSVPVPPVSRPAPPSTSGNERVYGKWNSGRPSSTNPPPSRNQNNERERDQNRPQDRVRGTWGPGRTSTNTPPPVTSTTPPARPQERTQSNERERNQNRGQDRVRGTWGPGRTSTNTPPPANTGDGNRNRNQDRERNQNREQDRVRGTWGPSRTSTNTPPPASTGNGNRNQDRERNQNRGQDRVRGTWGPGRTSTGSRPPSRGGDRDGDRGDVRGGGRGGDRGDVRGGDRHSGSSHRWTRPPVRYSTTQRPRPIYHVGYRRPRLPLNSFNIFFSSRRYYYCDGYYYLPSTYGYEVCYPPYGIIVPSLPWWYGTMLVGNLVYYVCDDVWYLPYTGGYRVVERPRTVVLETTVVQNPAVGVTTAHNTLDDSPDGTRHTIWLDGADGTRIPVDLVRVNGRWRGPKDEYYEGLPTVDQLAPLYAPAQLAVEEPAAEPTYRDDTKRIVWLENFNGSATRVVLIRSLSGKWVGEKGEFYPEFPTTEQLRKVYSIDVR